jgi:arylsulfatase A-like enzyme
MLSAVRVSSWLFCVFILLATQPLFAVDDREKPPTQIRPNFIIIYADDLGYGDLPAFGHPTIKTPAIDRLAQEGQRWTQFYSAAPVCTPSRGSLLTGRLPARLGLEAPSGMPNVFFSFSTGGLPHSEITLPELLKRGGYKTGLIGKWHLGPTAEHNPVRHGFDHFFGLVSSNDHDPAVPFTMELFFENPTEAHWAVPLYRNEMQIEVAVYQSTLHQRLTEDALNFIRTNKQSPYFLMFSVTHPHVPLFPGQRFRGASMAGLYGDAVEEIDNAVSRIIAAVKHYDNGRPTLIIFTSDNGPMTLMKENGGTAGLLRGGKGTTWEGGMRVPTIFWGKGLVKPGTIRDLGSQLDLFATIVDFAGIQIPADRTFDGSSLRQTLTDRSPTSRDTIFYYRAGRIFAIRKGQYKAHFLTQGGYDESGNLVEHDVPMIFDLWRDPSERYPIGKPDPSLISQFLKMRAEQIQSVPIAPSELLKGIPVQQAQSGAEQ